MGFSLHGSLYQSKSPEALFTLKSFRIWNRVGTHYDLNVIYSIVVYRSRKFEKLC